MKHQIKKDYLVFFDFDFVEELELELEFQKRDTLFKLKLSSFQWNWTNFFHMTFTFLVFRRRI